MVQFQECGTISRYGLKILHQYGKKVKTKRQIGLIPTFVKVTGKKPVGGPFVKTHILEKFQCKNESIELRSFHFSPKPYFART